MSPSAPARVFLLSPARLDGRRAEIVFRDDASFPVAAALRTPGGAPVGQVFAFLSGLYFRGKLAYAERFARAPQGAPSIGALVILQSGALVPVGTHVTLEALRELAKADVDHRLPAFRDPLTRAARLVAEAIGPEGDVVLLGSIASAKYVDPLTEVLGTRLRFPLEFVGRGDMSRGGLLLRRVEAAEELDYGPVVGAVRRGARPPKLVPRR